MPRVLRTRLPHSNRPVFAALGVVGLVALIWGVATLWRIEGAAGAKSGVPGRWHKLHAAANRGRSDTPEDAGAKAWKIKEAAAYWGGHKARLRQLLKVDYPAAVARRNAATPAYRKVEAYAKASQRDHEERLKQARAFLDDWGRHLSKDKLQKAEARVGNLLTIGAVAHGWDDPTPIAGGLTQAELTREMLAIPTEAAKVRVAIAQGERTLFHDEATARRVEAMQSAADLAAYAQGAQERYDQVYRQTLDDIGAGEQIRAQVSEVTNAEMEDNLLDAFLVSHNREVLVLRREYLDAKGSMERAELAEASGEDAEARRLLTEWKDMQMLLPTEWKSNN